MPNVEKQLIEAKEGFCGVTAERGQERGKEQGEAWLEQVQVVLPAQWDCYVRLLFHALECGGLLDVG
jgi:hypothetical protein